jgi:Flp pilus assembly protein TadG
MSQEARRVSIVTRFKNRLRNFRKGLGGFGMIEAALTLPIFLGLTFATIDYGLMMADRNSASGSISSLSRTIQDNPNITAAQLNILVANAGGGNAKFTGTGNCFCAQSFTTQAAAQTFVDGTGCGTGCDSGTRSTGTGTPRYIGVRGQVTYNFITPVNKIFVGESTKVLKFGQVVPVGITICPAGEALTSAGVCASSTVTCGAGQVLSSSNTCVNATISCGAGQFLTASGTCSNPVTPCGGAGIALQFDGTNWSCVNVLAGATAVADVDCYWSDWGYEWNRSGGRCAATHVVQSIDVSWFPGGDADAVRALCCRLRVQ